MSEKLESWLNAIGFLVTWLVGAFAFAISTSRQRRDIERDASEAIKRVEALEKTAHKNALIVQEIRTNVAWIKETLEKRSTES